MEESTTLRGQDLFEIGEVVRSIIAIHLELEMYQVDYDHSLMEDLRADQGDLAQIAFLIEQRFGLSNLAGTANLNKMEIETVRSITCHDVFIFVIQQLQNQEK